MQKYVFKDRMHNERVRVYSWRVVHLTAESGRLLSLSDCFIAKFSEQIVFALTLRLYFLFQNQKQDEKTVNYVSTNTALSRIKCEKSE